MVARRSRAESLTRASPGLIIGLCLVAASAVAAFLFDARPGEMRDFEVYWTAAHRAASGEPLYRPEDGHYQFKYLPAFAILARPIALLPLDVAKAAWFTASVVLLVALIRLSVTVLPELRRPRWVIVLAIVVAMGKFYGHELVLGQVNLLFAVVTAAALLFMRAGRDATAALLLAAAVVVKPYAAIFLPWLLWVRGARIAAVALLAVGCMIALPVGMYGAGGTVDLHRAWWATAAGSTAPNLTNADNVSVAAFFAKWLGTGPAATALAGLTSLLLVGAAAFAIRRRGGLRHPDILEGALLLTLVPLLSPQGWDYVFLVTTPAVALLVNYDDRLPPLLRIVTWTALLTIGLSLFDLMGRQRYAVFMNWSVITVAFVVLIGSLLSLRARRAA